MCGLLSRRNDMEQERVLENEGTEDDNLPVVPVTPDDTEAEPDVSDLESGTTDPEEAADDAVSDEDNVEGDEGPGDD